MSNDDIEPSENAPNPTQDVRPSPTAAPQKRSLFAIPPPLKRIFDKFPLVTYGENTLPLRAQTTRGENALYIFTTEEDARNGRPSFNPACLKWQTYLKFNNLSFETAASTNHASPSGSLPFLLPARPTEATSKPTEPVAGNKLKKWMSAQKMAEKMKEPENVQYEAYASLLENCIRKAWLFQLYLSPANAAVVHRLYIEPCSTNIFVQKTILYQLKKAAELELTKATASNTIIETDIMREAEEAIDALGALLGESEWFFGQSKPTLFDASVFAYTHLILDEKMGWQDNKLGDQLRLRENLIQHRNRILKMYY